MSKRIISGVILTLLLISVLAFNIRQAEPLEHNHEIAVIEVAPSKTVVGQGYSMNVTVTVENQGDNTETFDVTAYANTTIIDTLVDINLASWNYATVTFTWDTTGVAKGNYTTSAYATPVPGETDTADNTFVNGWVIVTIPGDTNGDFKVDHRDSLLFAGAYGLHEGAPDHVPEADINNDGEVDYIDQLIQTSNYGQSAESNPGTTTVSDDYAIIQGAMPNLYLDPSKTVGPPPDIGETLTLTMRLDKISDLVMWAVYIEWDPSKLELEGSPVEGPCLKSNPCSHPTFMISATIVPGKIPDLACVILGFIGCGVSIPPAPTNLASFTFEVKDYTGSTGTWINITQSWLYNSLEQEIPHTTTNAKFTLFSVNVPPVACFTISNDRPNVCEEVIFDPTCSHDPDGVIVLYEWDWDGDCTYDLSTPTRDIVSHHYDLWGHYYPKLRVTDNNGCTAVTNTTIHVRGHPVASFDHEPDDPGTGETITFNATASTPNGGTIINYRWDFGDSNITDTPNPIITHVYLTHGTYNVTLTVFDSEDKNDTTWQLVNITIHDVAVVNVTSESNWLYQGKLCHANINVTVCNEGDVPETFNVTLYCNITAGQIIGIQTVSDLPSGNCTTLTFLWDTTEVTPCRNYTITAVADTVPHETDTADNTLESPTKIKVRILGDVNDDSKVDIRDIARAALAFGSYKEPIVHPRWKMYDSEADIDNNGRIDIRDLALIAKNYGTCL